MTRSMIDGYVPNSTSQINNGGKTWLDWMKEGQFYVIGIVYMCSRIAMNATASFLPLYVALVTTDANTIEKGEVATTSF